MYLIRDKLYDSKSLFPILRDFPISYFDYAATTFMPEQVMAKWREVNSTSGVFLNRGNNILTKHAKYELQCSENIFRDFFNLPDEYCFIYFKNVTESINVFALSLEKKDSIGVPDIILVGPYEHHSNYLPWENLAKRVGATFCEMPTDNFGNPDYSFIEDNKDRIRVISISAVSNSFGYTIDIEKICSLISGETILLVDQSQVSAHMPILHNERISVHFLSSHKMYGPKNIAMAAIKRRLLDILEPVFLGGGMVESLGFENTWEKGRRKFFAGTMDIGLIRAWASSCEFISEISYSVIKQKNDFYSKKILKILYKYNFHPVFLENKCVNYIISFIHKKFHAHDINEFLSNNNVIIRSGNLCSQNALRKIGIYAINRISLGIGINDRDIQNLDEAMGKIAGCLICTIRN